MFSVNENAKPTFSNSSAWFEELYRKVPLLWRISGNGGPSGKNKWVTNCKGPHMTNTANAGSIRELISRNKMCIKAIDCKADTTWKTFIGSCRAGVSKSHVVSALQSIVFIHILFWLIRSLIDPAFFAVFVVCGPLQLLTHLWIFGP